MLSLIKKKNGKEFFTGERCHITELLNDENCPHLSIARCRVEPGITTQLHALKSVREVYSIEAGSGMMDDGRGNGFEVSEGDSIVVDEGHPQRIRNTGKIDLVFVVTCVPRFEPECYVNLEEEVDDV